MHRRYLLLLALAVCASPAQAQSEPPLLSWSRQIAMREQWLVKRQAMIPAMMRRQGVQMWIVVNEEFHNDPVTEFIAPPRPYAGNRDIFVFVDGGDTDGFHKIASPPIKPWQHSTPNTIPRRSRFRLAEHAA
jgi:Xaa-Pro dipeptidase